MELALGRAVDAVAVESPTPAPRPVAGVRPLLPRRVGRTMPWYSGFDAAPVMGGGPSTIGAATPALLDRPFEDGDD